MAPVSPVTYVVHPSYMIRRVFKGERARIAKGKPWFCDTWESAMYRQYANHNHFANDDGKRGNRNQHLRV